jgi:hypothetical protein
LTRKSRLKIFAEKNKLLQIAKNLQKSDDILMQQTLIIFCKKNMKKSDKKFDFNENEKIYIKNPP